MTTSPLEPMEPLSDKDRQRIIHALTGNWQEEMQGAATYRALADREDDPQRKAALTEMADSESKHAVLWAKRLLELGASAPVYTGAPTGTADTFANRVGGDLNALRRVELDERRDIARYGRQLQELGDARSAEILAEVMADERSHSRILKRLADPESFRPVSPLEPQDPAARLEALRARRHRRSPAPWIGDAIYGVNDGLGAIFGIVSGVSGATLGDSKFVLLAGLAGMVASALSMGSGAYLAAKSEREIYEAEVQRKREELEENPELGREEMALIYQIKGVPEDDARRLAEHLSKDPKQFLLTLAAEELNITEEALSNPFVSAWSGMLSTAVGAFVPIIPFFFMHGYPAVIAAAVISLAAHFAVGAAKTLITVRSWWSSGLEMTLVGAVEGVVTYLIGVGLGHLGA